MTREQRLEAAYALILLIHECQTSACANGDMCEEHCTQLHALAESELNAAEILMHRKNDAMCDIPLSTEQKVIQL